jgi:FkbM family methyltransferase
VKVRFLLGRLQAWAWRFHTLPLADRLFAGFDAPCVLERRLFGLRLRADIARGNPQRLLYLEGERFVGERAAVRQLLRPGMRAVDVGANIGYYLLLLESTVGPRGSVLCFEPEPANLRELEGNVRLNGFANAQIFAAAVGAEDGMATLRAGINAAITEDGAGDFTVPLVRLDSALTGPVDFVKIDVEGWEGQVLAGARRLLRQHRPALWVEVHPGFLAPPHTVDSILEELRQVHNRVEMLEIAPQGSFTEKVRARYLGRAVRRVPDPQALLAACREGRRQEPFWAVAPGPAAP